MAQIQPERDACNTAFPSEPGDTPGSSPSARQPTLFPPSPAFARHNIEPGGIHLRIVDLDDPGWDRLAGFLSVDEELRATRFPSAAQGTSYQRAQCALRLALAYYARKPPHSLVFDYGKGKPALCRHNVHFSMSRSANRALIAVGHGPVGTDLEFIGWPGIDEGEAGDGANRKRASLQLRTQKGAYCKALGTPLGQPPDEVLPGVSLHGAPAMVVQPVEGIALFVASVCSAGPASIRWY